MTRSIALDIQKKWVCSLGPDIEIWSLVYLSCPSVIKTIQYLAFSIQQFLDKLYVLLQITSSSVGS